MYDYGNLTRDIRERHSYQALAHNRLVIVYVIHYFIIIKHYREAAEVITINLRQPGGGSSGRSLNREDIQDYNRS